VSGTRSRIGDGSHDWIPERAVPERSELIVGEMNVRIGAPIEKTTGVVRSYTEAWGGSSQPEKSSWKCCLRHCRRRSSARLSATPTLFTVIFSRLPIRRYAKSSS